MKFLITGITGFAGPHLANLLIDNDHEVFGLVRHSNGRETDILDVVPDDNFKKINFVYGDLRNYLSISKVFEANKFDGVFHLAAQSHPPTSFTNPIGTMEDNVMGSANLIQAIELHNPDAKLMFCSTSEVYGQVDKNQIPINENRPINPVNPYSVSKCSQDQLVYSYGKAYDISAIRTRMFAYINPRRADLFATSFARQIVSIEMGKTKILKHGNLQSLRTLIDVRDAMDCYIDIALYGKPGETMELKE